MLATASKVFLEGTAIAPWKTENILNHNTSSRDAAEQIQRHQEQILNFCITFINWNKIFDTISNLHFGGHMERLFCPRKCVSLKAVRLDLRQRQHKRCVNAPLKPP